MIPERSTSWRARFSSAPLVGRPPVVSRGGRTSAWHLAREAEHLARPSAGRRGAGLRRTVTPCRPAAAANSGNRVPASRCQRSQVERSRAADSRGCPGGASRPEARELARLRDVEYPPTRNWSPAVEASSTTSASHWASTGTDRGAVRPHERAPLCLNRNVLCFDPGDPATVEPGAGAEGQECPSRSNPRTGALAPGIDGQSLDLRRRVGRGHLPSRHWRTNGAPMALSSSAEGRCAAIRPDRWLGKGLPVSPCCDEPLDGVRIEKRLGFKRYSFRNRPGCQPRQHSKASGGARPSRYRQSTPAVPYKRPD